MKKVCNFVLLLWVLTCPVFGAELLAPGDAIIAVDPDGPVSRSEYPGAESPSMILDGNVSTKYLNFGGWSRFNTGFIVTPGSTIVQSFQISTANDAESRDPVSYRLYGTNDPITSVDNSTGLAENWVLIDSGSLALPSDRYTAGSVINLTNSTAYSSYKMTFPETKNGVGGGLMQISEVDFYDSLDGLGTDLLSVSNPILGIQETPDSHHPLAEGPGNLIDGTTNKFLNFGKENSGFIVTPSGTDPVKGFQIMTANDFESRDPASWILYGTHDAITSTNNSQGLDENWVMIDSGTLSLSDVRFALSGIIAVDNDTAYASYKMLFPTLKDTNADRCDSMQISEIQFYDVPEPATLLLLGLGGLLLGRRK